MEPRFPFDVFDLHAHNLLLQFFFHLFVWGKVFENHVLLTVHVLAYDFGFILMDIAAYNHLVLFYILRIVVFT